MEEALFNPLDVPDICRVMQRALTDSEFYSALKAHAPAQAAKFTWDHTAQLALKGFERLVDKASASEPLDITSFTAHTINRIKNIAELSETERLQTASGDCS